LGAIAGAGIVIALGGLLELVLFNRQRSGEAMLRISWRSCAGLAIWLALIWVGWFSFHRLAPPGQVRAGIQRLVLAWSQAKSLETAEVQEPMIVYYRDPLFVIDLEGQPHRVGHVVSPSQWVTGGETLNLEVYGRLPGPWQSGRLELHRPNRNLGRVLEVMMTPARLRRMNEILLEMRLEQEEELLAELTPILRQALTELQPIIEEEVRIAIADHQSQLDRLSDKYQAKIVTQRLVPLVEAEILPVVERRATPLLEKIGKEMWRKVSLWRFAWRYVYDGSMRPSEPLVQQEWERFLQQHALPILRSHSENFVQVQTEIVQELAKNPRVTAAIRESLGEIVNDDEVWLVAHSILEQGVTENPRVQQKLQAVLQAPDTQRRFHRISNRLEPYAVRIGQELFGSPDQVNREFALVLRHMILQKDEQWIVWRPQSMDDDADDRSAGLAATPPPGPDRVTMSGIPLFRAEELGEPPFFIGLPEDRFQFLEAAEQRAELQAELQSAEERGP